VSRYFGEYGGQFVNELLMPALVQLEEAFERSKKDEEFQKELRRLLKDYAGRPTPLYHARNFSEKVGCKVYLKREDQCYGGSHKLNNALGQAMLTKYMGKSRIITETAAGQHGIATATAGTVLGLGVEVFMGVKDIKRQASNVQRIKLLGAKVTPVDVGSGVLKDAVSDTLRDWTTCLDTTHYLLGSSVGPYPFPEIVAEYQSVIGKEIKEQILEQGEELPDAVIACGSGGSNALGAFKPFLKENVELYFVEGGGSSLDADNSAAAFALGSKGVLHGAVMQLLQDEHGQVKPSKTRSAGLNYPGRGPELSNLVKSGRVEAGHAFDEEVFDAVKVMCETEALLPALETAHAIAYLIREKKRFKGKTIVLNYSGRGDKDIETILRHNDEN